MGNDDERNDDGENQKNELILANEKTKRTEREKKSRQ